MKTKPVQNGIQIERYERTNGRTDERTDAHQFFGTPTQKVSEIGTPQMYISYKKNYSKSNFRYFSF